jgi:hypothetical protein
MVNGNFNMHEDLIKIEITTPEAIAFRQFMQYNNNFMLLVNSGVFNINNGSATIHFGPNGEIGKIERKDNLFDIRIS